MIRILLLSDFASEYIRLLLKGVLSYSQKAGQWSFYRVPLHDIDLETIIGIAREWQADAIIGQITEVNLEKLRTLGIPIIIQNYADRISGISNLTGNYVGTGETAADFFLRKRYANYAFYGTHATVWSREREEGYRERLARHGHTLHSYNEQNNIRYIPAGSDPDQLAAWLRSLPKPVALFAADDSFAMRVTELCRIGHIDVPDEIAVLGVDNDEILCNMSDPSLSSVVLDVEQGGYQLARMLHQAILARELPSLNITVNPVRIEERRSTDKYVSDDQVVLAAMRFIRENCDRNLTVGDVVEHVHVSRRVVEKKFKAVTGDTIYRCILSNRIGLLAERIGVTGRPITDVAAELGFNDYPTMAKAFRRITGMTPTHYREARFNPDLREYGRKRNR